MPHDLLIRLLAAVFLVGGLVTEPVFRSAAAQGQQSCRLFGTGQDEVLYEVDRQTGGVTRIGDIGFGLTGLAQDPETGVLYGVTFGPLFQRQLVRVNPSTGAGTLIAPIPNTIQAIPDITFRDDGTLFGWVEGVDDLAVVNKETGATTVVGNAGIGTAGTGLGFTPDGVLYLTGNRSSGALRRVDPATGLTTVVATLSGAPLPNEEMPALAADPVSGTLFAVNMNNTTGESFLVTIDTTTGAITTRGPIPLDFVDALAFSCVSVAATANNDPNNDDEEEVERRRRRSRNNATRGEDESRTEGNVVGVRCVESDPIPVVQRGFIVDPDMLPYALIANRDDGVQKILLIRDAAKLCQHIRVGDYLEAEGEKQSEELFHADDVTVKKTR